MKKVIHFHFDIDKNIGDAAVVLAIRDNLLNNLLINQYSSKPIFYLTKINFYHFFESKIEKLHSPINVLLNNKIIIYSLVYIMHAIKFIKKSNRSQLISLINKHDLMILGGGGVYSKWTLPFDTKLIHQIKIPIVIIGAGYNRNYMDEKLSQSEIDSIVALNEKVKINTVRDEETYKILKSLNINTRIIGDPAIVLKSKKTDIKFNPQRLKIGLNVAYHEPHTRDLADKVLRIYINLVRELSKKYKIQIYYLKHSYQETHIVGKINKMFPDLIICDYAAREMKYVYENLDLIINMMLHSSIFAYASGAKFINIAYDIKNYSFMKLINNEKNIIDIRDLTYITLFKKSKALLNKHKKTDTNIVKITIFKNRIEKLFAEINSMLNSNIIS